MAEGVYRASKVGDERRNRIRRHLKVRHTLHPVASGSRDKRDQEVADHGVRQEPICHVVGHVGGVFWVEVEPKFVRHLERRLVYDDKMEAAVGICFCRLFVVDSVACFSYLVVPVRRG